MHRFKKTLKILSSALITIFVVYGIYGVFASAEDYSFEQPVLGFDLVKELYHDEINEYFNNKIELFLETDPDDENYVIPPEGEKCGKKNVSTYCVAMGALDMYYEYSATLDLISPIVMDIQTYTTAPVTGTAVGTVASLFSSLSAIDAKVEQEKADAMKVMDMTISTYNEFRLALPMHLKYKLVMEDLYAYVKSLRGLRYTLYSFPAKFINASSQDCK